MFYRVEGFGNGVEYETSEDFKDLSTLQGY